MKVKVQSLDAKAKGGDIELNDAVFDVEPRADILHRVVTWQLEKRRATARGARERSDVARTGKKFGRQKGGGTARHGDRRAPIFVGGGKAHGPRVRDFNPSLNKKVRALGLRMALSAKAKGGNLVVLEQSGPERSQDGGAQGAARQARSRQDGPGDRRRRDQRRLRPCLRQSSRGQFDAGGRGERLRHSQSRRLRRRPAPRSKLEPGSMAKAKNRRAARWTSATMTSSCTAHHRKVDFAQRA